MAKDLDELLDEVETKFCRLESLGLDLDERPEDGDRGGGGGRNEAEERASLRLTRAGGRFCSPTPPSAAAPARGLGRCPHRCRSRRP